MTDEKTLTAQLWQEHRVRCIELAIKAGTDYSTVINLAGQISDYIMTPSSKETPSVAKDVDGAS